MKKSNKGIMGEEKELKNFASSKRRPQGARL